MTAPAAFARVTGVVYLVIVVTSLFGFIAARGHPTPEVARLAAASNLISALATVTATVLLYELLHVVDRRIALLATAFGLVAVAHTADSLAFFGPFCLLTACLVYRSTFLPRWLGVVLALAGAGLLVNEFTKFFAPAFAHVVSPYGYALDAGEIVFTLWLIVFGVNERTWYDVADRAHDRRGFRAPGRESDS